MARILYIEKPEAFSFQHTIASHGWYDLPPFDLDRRQQSLTYVFSGGQARRPVAATIFEEKNRLRIEIADGDFDDSKLLAEVRHILRLDDDLGDFYRLIAGDARLSWAAEKRAGRLLRSPTVFEDLVKTLCTTNCSWALTKKMVTGIVKNLGEPTADGLFAFPNAEAMASVDESFYRGEIRCGYRSSYFVELAQRVRSGELRPELWLESELSTVDLKKEIKKIKGFGDYAADNVLKLLGRYDGLSLDSWLRSRFYATHNREKKCADKKIERHYAKFGKWKGLAIWCDMTESWFEERA